MNANEEELNGISKFDYQRQLDKTNDEIKETNKRIGHKSAIITTLEKNDNVQSYKKLIEDDMVQKYIAVKEDISKIEYDKYLLERKKQLLQQQLCKHPTILVTEEIKSSDNVVSSGICLACQKRLSPIQKENISMDSLVYIKAKSDNYFIEHDDIINVQQEYNRLKRGGNYSSKKLTKALNKMR